MATIIEIIGVSGSGKSTLTAKIKNNHPKWNVAYRLPKRKFFFQQLISTFRYVIPVLCYSERGWLISNIRLLIHIDVMSKILVSNNTDNVFVFDQGVIFEYASLCNRGLKNAPDKYKGILLDRITRSYIKSLILPFF